MFIVVRCVNDWFIISFTSFSFIFSIPSLPSYMPSSFFFYFVLSFQYLLKCHCLAVSRVQFCFMAILEEELLITEWAQVEECFQICVLYVRGVSKRNILESKGRTPPFNGKTNKKAYATYFWRNRFFDLCDDFWKGKCWHWLSLHLMHRRLP